MSRTCMFGSDAAIACASDLWERTEMMGWQEPEFAAFQLGADDWLPKRMSLVIWQTRISGFVSYNFGTAVAHRTMHIFNPMIIAFMQCGERKESHTLILPALHCLHPDLDLVCAFLRRLSWPPELTSDIKMVPGVEGLWSVKQPNCGVAASMAMYWSD